MAWDGAYNARDLGGLPTRDGRRTRASAFFRSASPRFMTADGWRQAREAGIATVVDLRRDDEVADDPSPTRAMAEAAGLTVVGVDLDGPEGDPVRDLVDRRGLAGTPLYVQPFLEGAPERVAAVMTALARAPEGGVLLHCQAGRDRTGLVALVLLALAGVEPEAVAEDYERSGPALAPAWERMGCPDEQPHVDAVLAEHGTSARAVLLDLLDGFDAEAYLLSGGTTAGDVDALRRRLVG